MCIQLCDCSSVGNNQNTHWRGTTKTLERVVKERGLSRKIFVVVIKWNCEVLGRVRCLFGSYDRPHAREMTHGSVAGFRKELVGKLTMPCDSGKLFCTSTLAGMWPDTSLCISGAAHSRPCALLVLLWCMRHDLRYSSWHFGPHYSPGWQPPWRGSPYRATHR